MIAISPAHAVTVVSSVEGSLSPTQETCFQGLTTSVGDGENCMYDGGPSSVATATPFGEITGPYNHIAYYDSVATPAAFQTTVVGLGRVRCTRPPSVTARSPQVINGSVTIDDNGNGFGADDLHQLHSHPDLPRHRRDRARSTADRQASTSTTA